MVDGAERSEGSMHREGSVHESLPEQQQRNFSEQSGSMGRVQGFYIYQVYIKKNEYEHVRVGGECCRSAQNFFFY